MGEHARPLEELRRGDEDRFGAKSTSLGELIGGEIPVPPGFALSAGAFEAFIDAGGLERKIGERMEGLDLEDVGALRSASAEIVELLRGEPLPDAIATELDQRYAELAAAGGEPEPPVAVRSSARGEDSAEATFAGQQETYLWVRGAEGVRDAVRDCWASLYSSEAIGYRARMAAGGEPPAMGVAVQAMVDAEISGVMFTCNPVSGDPSTVAVNASWGLGIAVVGGEVTPDEYRISKVTRELLHRSIGPKQIEYRPDPAGAGTVQVAVAAERQGAACLDGDRLDALLDLAKRVEEHFGAHQDIEWAIARDSGELFVLQSRPVTTAPGKREGDKRAQSAIAMVMSTFGADAKRSQES
jgi:pyruvate,water dikinase